MIIYVIKRGDTLYSIANMFGVTYESIMSDNGITDPQNLVVGQSLVIISESFPHIVRRGETFYSIAKSYGISVESLIAANPQINNANNILVGEVVRVPVPDENMGNMLANGYVFTSTRDDVLSGVMPNLSFATVFSYETRANGTLVPVADERVLENAKTQGVAPLISITNIDESGSFSGQITHEIFNSTALTDTLITNVLEILREKNYYGLNIDYEYVYPEDREAYNEFLRKITAALHEEGFIVTTSIAPQISDEMTGTLYEAHDYAAHGEIVDYVIIMTYEWGYTYGPPMAVAPINAVRGVLDYAVSRIPSQKILMGVPNYGYDWKLPYVEGSAAQALTNTAAINLAREKGAFIEYDERSQSPYFNYWSADGEHVVWFEDARSYDAQLRLVRDYDLAGVSYWNLNNNFPPLWLVQNALYDITKINQ